MGGFGTMVQGGLSMVKTGMAVDGVGKEAQFQLNEDQENIHLSKYAEAAAKARGAAAEGEVRVEGSQLAAKQEFLYANSGVDASVGTAANVVASTRALAEKDALTTRNNAAREAWGQSKVTSKLKRQKDVNLRRGGDKLNATVIGGLSEFAAIGASDSSGGAGGMMGGLGG